MMLRTNQRARKFLLVFGFSNRTDILVAIAMVQMVAREAYAFALRRKETLVK